MHVPFEHTALQHSCDAQSHIVVHVLLDSVDFVSIEKFVARAKDTKANKRIKEFIDFENCQKEVFK